MRLEIDVEPFRSAPPGDRDGRLDQLGSDAPPPRRWRHACVEQKSMAASIPRDIHESYQPLFVEGADMGQAPRQNCREIPILVRVPRRTPQPVQLVIRREGIDPENYR